MIINVEKTLGGKCPVCNENVFVSFSPFSINNAFAAQCVVCGRKFIKISKGKNDKYKISVDCYICEEEHAYEIGRTSFWKNDIFALGCHASGIDICYFGDKRAVKKAIQKLDDTLEEMTHEIIDDNMPEMNALMQECLSAIDKIANDNKITCPCKKCELTLRLCKTGVTVTCINCGASEFINLETQEDLEELKHRKSIILM